MSNKEELIKKLETNKENFEKISKKKENLEMLLEQLDYKIKCQELALLSLERKEEKQKRNQVGESC